MVPQLATLRRRTGPLAASTLFRPRELAGRPLPADDQWRLTVQCSSALVKAMGLTREDIHQLTDEWWAAQLDPIFSADPATCTIVWIQLNLVAGSLSMYLDARPDLQPLMDKILKFDVFGHFCLTEVEHGLDARNIETIATRMPCGGFDLHTPHDGAAKFMPPTAPSGFPSVAIVFARLVTEGKDHGIRSFLVDISDSERTYPGVTIRIVHGRAGCRPVKHSLTSFNHVKLPASALLDSSQASDLRARDDFSHLIWRVAVGTLSFVAPVITALKVSAFIAGKYSQRRIVAGPSKTRVPIINFSTQYRPVLMALANAFVLQAFYWRAAKFFSDSSNPYNQRHATATILKLLSQRLVQDDLLSLSERCGAQGLFAHNQIASLVNEIRGVGIAEGDAFVLTLRLVSELLMGKYTLPEPKDPEGILYAHEQGLQQEATEVIFTIEHHRSDAFNRLVLPRCEKIALGIGHRMAYEAAVEEGLDPLILNLYLASAIRSDEGWYAEKMGRSREEQFRNHEVAVHEALPHLDSWLEKLEVEEYVWAPIVKQDRWNSFFHNLEVAPSHGDVVERNIGNGRRLPSLESELPLKARL